MAISRCLTIPRLRPDDRGTVSGFVVVMAVALVLCAGLVFDGGRLVAARVEAADHAENAARIAAQETADLRGAAHALDPIRARRAADAYLAAHGLGGVTSVSGGSVTVTVTMTTPMTMLAAVGVPARTVTVARTAEAVTG